MGEWLEAIVACFHGYSLSDRDLTAPSPTPYVGVRLGDRTRRARRRHARPRFPPVAIRVSDGSEALHDEHENLEDHANANGTGDGSVHVLERRVPLYGRVREFDIQSTPAFHESSGGAVQRLIIACGVGLAVLLLTLFLTLSRANRNALSFADRMADKARANSAALEASNRDLASSNDTLDAFACVVPHDLKAPLLNIRTLVEFVREDLAERLDADRADAEIVDKLDKVNR